MEVCFYFMAWPTNILRFAVNLVIFLLSINDGTVCLRKPELICS